MELAVPDRGIVGRVRYVCDSNRSPFEVLSMPKMPTVGIIGAGISGLACAQLLARSRVKVTNFEKSRGVGGRMATRRLDSGITFDHGAQYFTTRDPEFASQVEQWCGSGVATEWKGRIVSLENVVCTELNEPRSRYIGVPSMNAIAKALATGLEVRTSTTVQSISRIEGQWQVTDATGAIHGPFDYLISSAPPVQTQTLMGELSQFLAPLLSSVVMLPCWAVMIQPQSPLRIEYDAAFVNESPLSWITRNSSKAGRDNNESWVLHGSAEWSRQNLEDSAERVATSLVDAFWNATRLSPQPLVLAIAHRWRYALPQEPLSSRLLLDHETKLGACGDWCGGPRVEGAYLSGRAMAHALVAQFAG